MKQIGRWWQGANPAERYCAGVGGLLVLVGVLGFVTEQGGLNFSTGDAVARGNQLGDFHVNGWHNLFHLMTGVGLFLVLLLGFRDRAPLAVLGFGVFYSLLAIWGFNHPEGSAAFGLVPLNLGNDAVHVVLGPLALSAGLASRTSRQPAPAR